MNERCVEQQFVNYFSQQGYEALPGGSLLDESIPTSFVMSVGYTQIERAAALEGRLDQNKYVMVQNCFRYFDLEMVGKDDLHLSLFRMSGAFTFGKVDRRAYIANIWKLLIDAYHLLPKNVWITWFCGEEGAEYPLTADEQTYAAWLEVGVPGDHLIGMGKVSNFWEQHRQQTDQTQPPLKCGPNCEVFFDRGTHFGCKRDDCHPGCDCGRFVEFMNTLFVSSQIDPETSSFTELPEPYVETVIGIERLAMLLQPSITVFETNSLGPVLKQIQKMEQCADIPEAVVHRQERILADHIKALIFLVLDGAPPPNKKGARGYIMRKLARRLLTSMKLLGIQRDKFLIFAGHHIAAIYGDTFPVDRLNLDKVVIYLDNEATRFDTSIAKAGRFIDQWLNERPHSNDIPGETIVSIEKSKGIPIDLLQQMVFERHAQYRQDEYEAAAIEWRRKQAQSKLSDE